MATDKVEKGYQGLKLNEDTHAYKTLDGIEGMTGMNLLDNTQLMAPQVVLCKPVLYILILIMKYQ